MAAASTAKAPKRRATKAPSNPTVSDSDRARALEVTRQLVAKYGELKLVPRREPMHELISTMLSHRTNHANESAAYRRMWEKFGSWEGIRDAPVDELTEAIAPSNFPEVKAPNIKEALRRIIDERGDANIDFLREWPPEDAQAWLMSLPGVGIKTATLVLLFCFGMPVLPVDTHVHRIAGRIGMIGPKVSAAAAHGILLAQFPPNPVLLFNFHKSMLKHGQQVCIWSVPRCEQCPLTNLCDWYQANRLTTKD